MDGAGNAHVTLPQEPQKKKKGFLKGLFFLEIGLFEIGFVIVVLALIFGALSYFRVIKLQSTFSHLPFLSQRFAQNTAPTPTPLPLSTIQSTLITYAKNTILPALLPGAAIQALPVKKKSTGFQLTWAVKEPLIIILFTSSYDKTQTHLQQMKGYVFFQDASLQVSTPAAQKVAQTYFTAPESLPDWHCADEEKGGKTTLCEQYGTTNAGGIGYSFLATDATKSAFLIFTCFIPKQSPLFTTTSSCASNGI